MRLFTTKKERLILHETTKSRFINRKRPFYHRSAVDLFFGSMARSASVGMLFFGNLF